MVDGFVAFDIETANLDPESICEIAFVKYDYFREDGNYPTAYTLVRPEGEFEVYWGNMDVHGLRKEDLFDAPQLGQVWNSIEEFLEDYPLVAHGATNDINKIIKTLSRQGMAMADRQYYCSLVMARNIPDVLSDLPFSVETLSALAGVQWNLVQRPSGLNGHHALIDAAACGGMMLNYLERYGGSFAKACEILNLRPGLIEFNRVEHGNTKVPTNKYFDRFVQFNEKSFEEYKSKLIDQGFVVAADHVATDKNFVLTLELENLSTREFWNAVALAGGKYKSGVTARVDFLVEGSVDPTNRYERGESPKSEKARMLNEIMPATIAIMSEFEFCELMGNVILEQAKTIEARQSN